MNVRCKFVCIEKIERADTAGFKFSPVSSGSEENKQFWKWTPSGSFEFQCLNPDVKFEVGKSYYFDISPAE